MSKSPTIIENINFINKYHITKVSFTEDYKINADEVVIDDALSELTQLPVHFNNIKNSFSIYLPQLENLKGFPKTIEGSFYCESCKVTSLEGAPEHVGLNYSVYGTDIKNLYGTPQTINKLFDISCTNIKNFEGCPKEVYSINCDNCSELETLSGASQMHVIKDFRCCLNGHLVDINDLPEIDGNFYCIGNANIVNLDFDKNKVHGHFIVNPKLDREVIKCNPYHAHTMLSLRNFKNKDFKGCKKLNYEEFKEYYYEDVWKFRRKYSLHD